MLAISIVPLPIVGQSVVGHFVPRSINPGDTIAGTVWGVVSGGSTFAPKASFVWQEGQGYSQVGPANTGSIQYWVEAKAIDAAGDVGGFFYLIFSNGNDSQDIPFRSIDGKVQRLDTGNSGMDDGEVLGLNSAGDAVGIDNNHATLWKAGTTSETDLGLPSDSYSSANAINDKGQIVGYSGQRPFLLSGAGATPTFLPTKDGESANAFAIDDNGWIIGVGAKGEGLLWAPDPSTGQDGVAALDFTPLGINNHNVVVGAANTFGVVWTAATGDVTINSVLPADLQYNPITRGGWSINGITGINDHNDITGIGTFQGDTQTAYLLTGLDLEKITPTSLQWGGTAQGGVDFSYDVAATLQRSTSIGLYWATGPDITDIIGGPIFSQPIGPGPAGTFGPIHVPQSALGSPPIAAKDLLLVADPGNVVDNPDDTSRLMALARGPEVVNVVTHGFNPYQPWNTFLAGWDTLRNELNDPKNTGPVLSGRVATYRPQWDSTSGWAGDLLSAVASYLLPSASQPLAVLAEQRFANQAAALAEKAAEDIDRYITTTPGYLTAPGAGQVIDLVGHSRGAAVDARVSQLLKAQGYTVSQYISLDGYSTDWPAPSNHFGDISIVDNATAKRKVNDEVEQGLLGAGVGGAPPVLFSLLNAITGLPLTGDETKALALALANVATDWRAPNRGGFENGIIPGTHTPGDPNYWSNHTNITALYSNTSYPYIKSLYDWIYASASGGSQASHASPALASVGAAGPNYSDFRDGSFASLGSFWSQVQAAKIDTGKSTVLAAWLGMVDNPAQLLTSTWDVAGDAQLAQGGGNTLGLLSLAKGTASIGQYLELDPNASTVGIDLTTLSAKAGDQLQLLFGGNVVSTWNLSSLPINSHLTASIAMYASQNGELTLQLVGPSGDAVKVGLDNLSVLDSTTTVAGPSTYGPVRGQSMTLYAVVSASPGSRTPTGTVSFKYGSTVIATEPLVTANGTTYAALPVPSTALGTDTFTTVYNGDAADLPSQGTMTFTVGEDATTVNVGPSDFAPVRGESLAINAIVAIKAPGSGSPTGTVTFKYGAQVLATEPVLSAGGLFYARLPAVPFGMGTYTFTAIYNGDAGDTASLGATTFTVGPDATTTVAGPSIFGPIFGQALSLNVIVGVKAPGAGTPTGTVTFKYGSKVVGTTALRTLNGLTYASLALPTLGPGTYTFTAVYGGDAGDRSSTTSTTFTVSASSHGGSAAPAALPAGQPVPTAVPAGPASGFAPAIAAGSSWKNAGQLKPRRPWLAATFADEG